MSREIIFFRIVISIIISFIISFFLLKQMLKNKRNTQIERNYLDTHLTKNGTTSGGGKAFFLSTNISFFISSLFMPFNYKIVALLFSGTMFFLIGLIDDESKRRFKSYNGLSARVRILLEVLVLIYLVLILKNTPIDLKTIHIPLLDYDLNIAPIYLLFLGVVLIGSSNSINLTDGLDGLASGLVMIAISPFILLSILSNEYVIAIYLSSLVGSLMAFLYFNFHPAKIFMGDCGSLYLGALLATVSIILRNEIILFISGFLFVLEALSVIIQVIYFKLTRKRIFLMTPIHHHFEKKGFDEVRVVMGFYLVGIFLSVFSIIVEVI